MKTTEWRIYHDYVLEENRITPKPGVGYRIYDPLDQFYDDQESQPIYIELANIAITRLKQEKYGKPTTRLAEDLLDFTKNTGHLELDGDTLCCLEPRIYPRALSSWIQKVKVYSIAYWIVDF